MELIYRDIEQKLAGYGYTYYAEGAEWFKNAYACDIYCYIHNNQPISIELETKFLANATWNIPIILLFSKVEILDSVSDGITYVASDQCYYSIKPHLFAKCVKSGNEDNSSTVKQLFEYALLIWGINTSVISKEEFNKILSKTVKFTGCITAENIKNFIENSI